MTAPETSPLEAHGRHDQAIVDVSQSQVERQTIGNCWVYASSGWAESLHLRATGAKLDVSESYWTYMHWFLQLTNAENATKTEISTGGELRDIQRIVAAYGVMNERDFIAADSEEERAFSQLRALEIINAALAADGELAKTEDRANPAKVREVLDDAWRLSDSVRAQLTDTFGADLSRTFRNGATVHDAPIMTGAQIATAYSGRTDRTLTSALAEWREIGYTLYSSRATLRRVQRALHASEPVVASWFVDFNALEGDTSNARYGSFNLATLNASGQPGRQGMHMTVVEDYQARLHGEVFTTISEASVPAIVARGAFELIQLAEAPSVRVEAGQALTVAMTGDGDADLYVQTGEAPSLTKYVCRPYKGDSSETCSVAGPADVFVAVSGYRAANAQLTFTTQTVTETDQLLVAGTTLDPKNADDAALLRAALDDSTEIEFLRVKNSWGANRPGLAMVKNFERGYHDLYFEYLNGPVAEAKECEEGFEHTSCSRERMPLASFILPPGY